MSESPTEERLSFDFLALWFVQIVNLVGDQIFPIALIALLLDQQNAALGITAIVAGRFTAMALLIIVGGSLADRFSKFRLIVSGDLVQASFVAILLLTPAPHPLWWLVVCSFAVASAEALFKPTLDALVPELVAPSLRQRANGLVGSFRSISRAAGPALGAAVVVSLGVRTALIVDLATFAISATVVSLLARRRDPGSVPRDKSMDEISIAKAALAGFGEVWRLEWLRNLEMMAVLHTLVAVGPWMVLLPLVIDPGGFDSRLVGYGAVLSAFFVGGAIGAWWAGNRKFEAPGFVALTGISVFSLVLFAMAFEAPLPVTVVVSLAAGIGSQVFDVIKVTAIQRQVPETRLGRVMSVDFFASFVVLPLGQVVGGLLIAGSVISASSILFFGGVVVLTTSLPLILLDGSMRTFDSAAPMKPG